MCSRHLSCQGLTLNCPDSITNRKVEGIPYLLGPPVSLRRERVTSNWSLYLGNLELATETLRKLIYIEEKCELFTSSLK